MHHLRFIFSDLAAVHDGDCLAWLSRLGTASLYFLYHVHALDHLTKHSVLPVQPGARHGCNEELRPVCVRTRVGH